MGGKAFSSRPSSLKVVRLTPSRYLELCDECEKNLFPFYAHINTPPEAPNKPDHGDIDILVLGPLHKFSREEVAEALGAKDHLQQMGSVSSFAIPIPGSAGDECFQLDIRLCSTKDLFQWSTMLYSYGDLWRILGCAVNRFGFTINDTGLQLRVVEIEHYRPKECLLWLTSDSTMMMDFLDLDADRFRVGFSDLNEIFMWATSSRLFRRRCFEKQRPKVEGKKAERLMYLDFVTRWLPQHPERGGCGDGDDLVREGLREEALAKFQKHDELGTNLESHRKRTLKDSMWSKIARALPLKGTVLGEAVVALKSLMSWQDGTPGFSTKSEETVERVPALDEEVVDDVIVPWVLRNWQDVVSANRKNRK
ncbi:hypothetical protein G7Y79_00082g100890 [Physcia stellaris]|nr:hypothetical protein G7Y79_00082g100890 [Physcia stellaris]